MNKQMAVLLALGFATTAQARQITVSKQDIVNQFQLGAIANVTINGQKEKVLADPDGITVYTFDKDSPNQSVCKDSCLTEWPPVHVPAQTTPQAPFGQITGNDGQPQLTLQGYPLYHYDDDKKPGDAFGVYPEWEAVLVTDTTPRPFAAPLANSVSCSGENDPYTVTFELPGAAVVGQQLKIHELLKLSGAPASKPDDQYEQCTVSKVSPDGYVCEYSVPSYAYKLNVTTQNGRVISAHEDSGGCGCGCSEAHVDYTCQ